MTRKWLVAAGFVAAGVLAVGLLLGGAALADERWGFMAGTMGADHAAVHTEHMAQSGGQMATMHEAMGGQMAAMHESMGKLMAEMPAIHDQVLAAVAGKLELSPTALADALAGGQTLSDVAARQKVPLGEVKGAMVQAMEQAVGTLVQAGKLDAEAAARLRGQIAQHAELCLTTNMGAIAACHG